MSPSSLAVERARRDGKSPPAPMSARFQDVLDAYGRPLERLAASFARSPAERDDLLQDIALALCLALPSFRGDASERTFVMRVALNRALTFAARRGAPTADLDDHPDRAVTSSSDNPAIVYERKEREHRLMSAVRSLPFGLRQVILLSLEGMTHPEIADVLGVTTNVVAVRANRARAALRVLLDTDGSTVKGDAS